VDLAFFAPANSDIEILSVILTGKGVGPPGLATVPIPNDNATTSTIPKLYIYIGAGVGGVLLLLGLSLLLWCCFCKVRGQKIHLVDEHVALSMSMQMSRAGRTYPCGKPLYW
jgi:hypothetical protein